MLVQFWIFVVTFELFHGVLELIDLQFLLVGVIFLALVGVVVVIWVQKVVVGFVHFRNQDILQNQDFRFLNRSEFFL